MQDVFRKWFHDIFADEESLILLIIVFAGLAIVVTMGGILAPFIASLIFAFLLQGLVSTLQRWGLPRWLALALTYLCFVGSFLVLLVFVLPLAWKQLVTLFTELPRMIEAAKQGLVLVQQRYPEVVSEALLAEWTAEATSELTRVGQWMLSVSVSQLPNVFGVLIYLVLVPILVFFLLKDKDAIFAWFAAFLPSRRPLMYKVWREMDQQVANYARGKAIEILLVWVASYLAFVIMGLKYAALLGLLVGVSVLIPYIGAAVVTLPVALVGYFQWGWTEDFFWLCAVYGIIQFLDGNLLVPLLFSETVKIHPIAIILAVLVFGGLWGLWGVFFAIPLATLIKALIQSWPRRGAQTVDVEANAQ